MDNSCFQHGRERRQRYRTFKKLGDDGTEGTVKVAYSLDRGQPVALKALEKLPRPCEDNGRRSMDPLGGQHTQDRAWAVAQAKKKWSIIATLKHPNLLQIDDIFETEQKLYIATQLAEGDLQSLLNAKGTLCEDDVRKIIRGLLEGLVFLHSHGIAHRDLKPQNLLLKSFTDLASICIADFTGCYVPGVSKTVETLSSVPFMESLVGTPFFLAPSVVRGENYTASVDVYAAGCIAYQLIVGRTPFEDSKTFSELYTRILTGDWCFPESVEVSDEFRDFVQQLMARDSLDRPSAVEALQHPWLACLEVVRTDSAISVS